jgi:hypothetical protein
MVPPDRAKCDKPVLARQSAAAGRKALPSGCSKGSSAESAVGMLALRGVRLSGLQAGETFVLGRVSHGRDEAFLRPRKVTMNFAIAAAVLRMSR